MFGIIYFRFCSDRNGKIVLIVHFLKLYMKFEYWVIGKTKEKYLISGEQEFLKRLKRYTKITYHQFTDIKGAGNNPDVIKQQEAEMVLGQCGSQDYLILLDEKGPQYKSVDFAKKIGKYQMSTSKRVIFLTGGAYGFHESVYERSQELLALSKMTFSHQMVRLFFLEQVYRAFTIIRGEKYHNE